MKSRYCTGFRFLDEELPSQYYKDLVYDLHCRSKQAGNIKLGDEQDDSKLQMLKALEELKCSKSSLEKKDKFLYFLVGVVAMLSIVIAVVVIN